jgi:hypothetical protein
MPRLSRAADYDRKSQRQRAPQRVERASSARQDHRTIKGPTYLAGEVEDNLLERRNFYLTLSVAVEIGEGLACKGRHKSALQGSAEIGDDLLLDASAFVPGTALDHSIKSGTPAATETDSTREITLFIADIV